ncbi:hypothetical protein RJT34_12260 [Clitoria ternatea]|uniref:Uncharacterized protein n=1 Tax=Clitoria ternatea TaxID=43366 RepID=A0AAN9PL76_CLITE
MIGPVRVTSRKRPTLKGPPFPLKNIENVRTPALSPSRDCSPFSLWFRFPLPRLLDTRGQCSLLLLSLVCCPGDLVPLARRVCLLLEAPSVAGHPRRRCPSSRPHSAFKFLSIIDVEGSLLIIFARYPYLEYFEIGVFPSLFCPPFSFRVRPGATQALSITEHYIQNEYLLAQTSWRLSDWKVTSFDANARMRYEMW